MMDKQALQAWVKTGDTFILEKQVITGDLTGIDLSGGTFEQVDFSNALLDNALIKECTFNKCTFNATHFKNAQFTYTNFIECKGTAIQAQASQWQNASVIKSQFEKINLANSQ
ncbi:MAG: pentapeptide repeat-containing protein, partial [Pseudomonadaceae bacterium]|nr:pentapeptide repeat-containing protein [Pseudomonadaceae bacterium]